MSKIVEKVHQKVKVPGKGLRIEKLGARQVGYEFVCLYGQTVNDTVVLSWDYVGRIDGAWNRRREAVSLRQFLQAALRLDHQWIIVRAFARQCGLDGVFKAILSRIFDAVRDFHESVLARLFLQNILYLSQKIFDCCRQL